jgi:hypothetical protein
MWLDATQGNSRAKVEYSQVGENQMACRFFQVQGRELCVQFHLRVSVNEQGANPRLKQSPGFPEQSEG